MNSIQAIVLAAGKSTRFGEFFNKLLIPLCGKPLITYVTDILHIHSIPTTVVVGHLKEKVIATITEHNATEVTFVTQEEALGTGHALLCSKEYWNKNNILVLNGDMPLITPDLITELIATHTKSDAAVTFVTAIPDTTQHAYGRVIINNGTIQIVEARDFKGDTSLAYPINAGIYLFKRSFLEQHAQELQPNNAQKQLYITDLIGIASTYNHGVMTVSCAYDLVRGVNTLAEFTAVCNSMRTKTALLWLAQGVLIEDPTNTWIDTTAYIGTGTRISSGVHIRGTTHIGTHCTLNAYSVIENSIVGDSVTLLSHSIISNSTIGAHTHIGPFAHIHSATIIDQKTVIGNFVEIKKSNIGSETKAKHLSYLGDALVGNNVNIGAGTITCNYDGTNKSATIIEDNSFIGSNSILVAPITIGSGAYTAAGSTITQSVPNDALAIGRARQINKPEYAKRLRPVKKIPLNTAPHPTSLIEL